MICGVFSTIFFSLVSPILFFYFAFSYNSKLFCSQFSPEDVLCQRFSHRIAPILWLYTTIACIVIISGGFSDSWDFYHWLIRLIRINKDVRGSTGFAVVFSVMQRLHEAAFPTNALLCVDLHTVFSEKCLFAVLEQEPLTCCFISQCIIT